MKRIAWAAMAALALLCAEVCPAQTGYVTVSGSHLTDSTGASITNATISFAPTNAAGTPIGYRVNGNGQAITSAVTAQVTSGAFTITVADTNLTYPQNVCFNVTVTDNASGNTLLGGGGSGYSCVQPAYNTTLPNNWCASGTCNFDHYPPSGQSLLVSTAPSLSIGTVTTGGAGTPAAASITQTPPDQLLNLTIPQGQGYRERGAWAPSTAYLPYDVYQYSGTAYAVTTAYTSGASFGSTDTSNATIFANGGSLGYTAVNKAGDTMTGALTAPQFFSQQNPQYAGLDAVGDSICSGERVSGVGGVPWESLLAQSLGGTNNNACVSGQYILDEPWQLLNKLGVSLLPTVGTNPVFLEEGGKNDADTCAAGSSCITNSQMALQAVFALWGTINRVAPSAGIENSGGSWAANSNIAYCRSTTTNADSVTYTITTYNGSPIYVLALNSATNGGTASVTIDGVGQTGLTLNGSGETAYGNGWTVFGYPYAVSSGSHTVTVAATSATGSGNVVGVCGVTSGNNPATAGEPGTPLVWSMEVLPAEQMANPTYITSINAMKQAVINAMAGQGFNVKWAPIVNVPYTSAFNDVWGIANQGPTAVSAWTCSGTSCTFTVSSNYIQVGATAQLSGFTTTTALNGKTGPVTAENSTSITVTLAFPAGSGTEVGSISAIDRDGNQCSSTENSTNGIHPNICGNFQEYRSLLADMGPLTGGSAASTPASRIACNMVVLNTSQTLTNQECYILSNTASTFTLPSIAQNGYTYTLFNYDTTGIAPKFTGVNGYSAVVVPDNTAMSVSCYWTGSVCNWLLNSPSQGQATTGFSANTTINSIFPVIQCSGSVGTFNLTIPNTLPKNWQFTVINNGSYACTLVAGSGMTFKNGVQATINPGYMESLQVGANGASLYSVTSMSLVDPTTTNGDMISRCSGSLGRLANNTSGSTQVLTETSGGCPAWGNATATTATAWCSNQSSASNSAVFTANEETLVAVNIPLQTTIGHLFFAVSTADSTSTDYYSVGLFNSSGTAICTTAAAAYTSTGAQTVACSQGSGIVVPAGTYYLGWTGNANVAKFYGNGTRTTFYAATSFASTSGGAQPASITAPSPSPSIAYAQMTVCAVP